jgi:superfamily II DNA or RNA helicase
MAIELKHYQLEAVDTMLSSSRLILADVPGLGKTYPAIVAAFALPSPRLFVVPSYLQYNWYREINNLFNARYSVILTLKNAHRSIHSLQMVSSSV